MTNKHAKRLREMAEIEKQSARYSNSLIQHATKEEARGHEDDRLRFEQNAATLLAGAAAIEALEVAREALSRIYERGYLPSRDEDLSHSPDCTCHYCDTNREHDALDAALARLEAL